MGAGGLRGMEMREWEKSGKLCGELGGSSVLVLVR